MKKQNIVIGILILAIILMGYLCYLKGNKVIDNNSQNITTQTENKVVKNQNEMYAQDKEAFPKTLEGYKRYVIDLDALSNEDKVEVELIAGLNKEVDCNIHMLMGDFETRTVEGYGFDYYVFNSNGDTASTLMGCPDDSKTTQFVSKSMKIRYNSKLPVVVFAPENFEVKYNIWSAGAKDLSANQD